MKKRLKRMLDSQIDTFNGDRLGYFKPEMKDKLLWLYGMGALSNREYNKYLSKIENKYTEVHDKHFRVHDN